MARPKKGTTFWDRVEAHVHTEGDCHVFNGHRDECGYGRIRRNGQLVRVHRAVWERDHGAIPSGMVVMHSCDNPACCNPSHLSLGTQVDNIKDMDAKGRRRSLSGSENRAAKLTEENVRVIRARLLGGERCPKIGRDFDVSEETIRSIKKGRIWTHV